MRGEGVSNELLNLEDYSSNMYECPLCGKAENRRGSPFQSPDAVVRHIDGCHDKVHSGESGAGFREKIEATAGRGETADQVDESQESDPTDSDSTTDTNTTDADETVGVTPEEIDQMIQTAAEEARQEGYEDGYEAAKEEFDTANEDSADQCPECSSTLRDVPPGKTFYSEQHDTYATVTPGDSFCPACEAIVEPDNTLVY